MNMFQLLNGVAMENTGDVWSARSNFDGCRRISLSSYQYVVEEWSARSLEQRMLAPTADG
jgi:hypothetical protein